MNPIKQETVSSSFAAGFQMTTTTKKPSFVKVTDEEQTDEPIELPIESDGTISLATVSAQFPGASGLKYKNPETGTFRGLRLDDQTHVHPPNDGWGDLTYIVVFPKENTKRKIDADHVDSNAAASKQKRVERTKCSDLIVLGLPYKTTEDELREYFEQFGEVIVSQVKRDPKTDKSKGFGFVRFTDYDSQLKVLSQRHHIEGRWCDVKIPNSKVDHQTTGNRKIFVGRLSENISTEDLREFFEKLGEVTDVFIPKPFRGFAFVTFADADLAQTLCGEDYVIRHCSVHVSPAAPKDSSYTGSVKYGRSHGVSGSNGASFSRSLHSPGDRRSEYYNFDGEPVPPQAKMNRNQVWTSFPSNNIGGAAGGSYGVPWGIGNGNGMYHHMQGGGDKLNMMGTTSAGGRSLTPVPPTNQPPPPQPPPSTAVMMPTSVNSQNSAASATNQATVGMGALNLGSFNISSLLSPALFAAAQAAILHTLAQTGQTLTSGAPTQADLSSALLNVMPAAGQIPHVQAGAPQPSAPAPGTSATVSGASASWWPAHSTSVVAAVPSSAVPPPPSAMTTTMSGEMVAAATNGGQAGRPVGVWNQEDSWRK